MRLDSDTELERERDDERDEELPRRGFLQGIGAVGIGIGGGMGSPQQIAEAIDALLEGPEEQVYSGPHAVATWQAVVDAIIPETPDLAEKLGSEHRDGGLAIELERGVIDFIDSFLAPEATVPRVTGTGETPPLSAAVAAVLDGAAGELVARGGNRDQPQPGRFENGGTFAALSRRDRYRAIADIESQGGKYGGFVAAIVAAFPAILYYSEFDGYDDFSDKHGREFTGEVQAWGQTDYPGPTDGFAVLRGYEVREFEETYDADPDTPPGPDGTDLREGDDAGGDGDGSGTVPDPTGGLGGGLR